MQKRLGLFLLLLFSAFASCAATPKDDAIRLETLRIRPLQGWTQRIQRGKSGSNILFRKQANGADFAVRIGVIVLPSTIDLRHESVVFDAREMKQILQRDGETVTRIRSRASRFLGLPAGVLDLETLKAGKQTRSRMVSFRDGRDDYQLSVIVRSSKLTPAAIRLLDQTCSRVPKAIALSRRKR